MSEEQINPAELGIVIEPKEVVYWKQVLAETERELQKCENVLKFQKACKEMAEGKLSGLQTQK